MQATKEQEPMTNDEREDAIRAILDAEGIDIEIIPICPFMQGKIRRRLSCIAITSRGNDRNMLVEYRGPDEDPTLSSAVYCLIMDYRSCEENDVWSWLREYCETVNEDNFLNYQLCRRQSRYLKKMMSLESIEKLIELLEDY